MTLQNGALIRKKEQKAAVRKKTRKAGKVWTSAPDFFQKDLDLNTNSWKHKKKQNQFGMWHRYVASHMWCLGNIFKWKFSSPGSSRWNFKKPSASCVQDMPDFRRLSAEVNLGQPATLGAVAQTNQYAGRQFRWVPLSSKNNKPNSSWKIPIPMVFFWKSCNQHARVARPHVHWETLCLGFGEAVKATSH